jgi:teichuronic acid biosynthesis glycosyltransferase TuaC
MRVLFVAENYPNNVQPESGRDIHQQALALKRQNIDVQVVAPIPWMPFKGSFRGWPDYNEVYAMDTLDGVQIYHPRYLTPPRFMRVDYWKVALPIQYKPLFTRIRRTFRFDLVHGQNLFPEGHVAIQMGQNLGVPALVSSRGSDAAYWPHQLRRYRRAVQDVIQLADQMVTVSYAQRKLVEALAPPMVECQVVYNGVDPVRFVADTGARDAVRLQLGLHPNHTLLIFVGALVINKGIRELLEAFQALAVHHSHIHLALIGKSNENWQAAVNSELHQKVHFVGAVSGTEVVNWLNAGDVFVFPSYREGLPNAVLEAGAVGLPIVATHVGGIPEVIRDQVNGLLVPPQDVSALTMAIDRLIRDSNLRTQFRHRVRNDVLNTFSWSVHGTRLKHIYEQLLSRTSRAITS